MLKRRSEARKFDNSHARPPTPDEEEWFDGDEHQQQYQSAEAQKLLQKPTGTSQPATFPPSEPEPTNSRLPRNPPPGFLTIPDTLLSFTFGSATQNYPFSSITKHVTSPLINTLIQDHSASAAASALATAASSLPPISPATFSGLRSSSSFGLPSHTSLSPSGRTGYGLGNVYGMSGSLTPSAAWPMHFSFTFPETDIDAMSPASSTP